MTARPPVRVALVNDYEVVVEGVASMMRHHRDRVEVVELDASPGGTAGTLEERRIDVALFDTFAHGRVDGHIVDDLLERDNVDAVVVYSWSQDDVLVSSCLERGARGFLSKALPASAIVSALECIRAGETVVRPEPARPTSTVAGDWPGREEGLTPREAEVLALITRGLSNEQIALTTQLSPNSVKSYIRGAYRKISVTSRTRAVLWALDHGFSGERADASRPRATRH
ncbi:response regulator transcription factor [Nocardioidaceae bacterium]|nr:response regulator transcription factor [Nocardioidaceae bacterium]